MYVNIKYDRADEIKCNLWGNPDKEYQDLLVLFLQPFCNSDLKNKQTKQQPPPVTL